MRPPPWHFAGHVLFFEIEAREPQALVPGGAGLELDDGAPCGFAFAFWHFWRDDEAELLDPVLGQFWEAFALVPCRLAGQPVAWCPFIWVDSAASVVRGWLQGLPKKSASVWLTRPLGLGRGPRLARGSVVAGSLAASDRRVAEGRLTLTEPVERPPALFSRSWVNRRRIAGFVTGDAGEERLVRSRLDGVEWSACWRGVGELNVWPSPHDEVDALIPERILGGCTFEYAESLRGGELVEGGR